MPRFDGTGPMGYGPRTGRGMGPCGLGLRRGWGCYGWGSRQALSPKDELSSLEEEEKLLENELKALRAEKQAAKNKTK